MEGTTEVSFCQALILINFNSSMALKMALLSQNCLAKSLIKIFNFVHTCVPILLKFIYEQKLTLVSHYLLNK